MVPAVMFFVFFLNISNGHFVRVPYFHDFIT